MQRAAHFCRRLRTNLSSPIFNRDALEHLHCLDCADRQPCRPQCHNRSVETPGGQPRARRPVATGDRTPERNYDVVLGTSTPAPVAAEVRLLPDHASSRAGAACGVTDAFPFLGRASPLGFASAAVSNSERNGFTMSIGIGKMTVEFCSAPISASVCR